MKFGEVFSFVNTNANNWLEKDKSGKGYICPICGSGSGKKGTGITENPRNKGHYTCWAGECFSNMSYIDILALKNGIDVTNRKAVVDNACKLLNINYENEYTGSSNKVIKSNAVKESPCDYEEDLSTFFEECHQNIDKTDYWQKRGLSRDVIDRFNIGFCENWINPKAEKQYPSARLIIPTSKGSYLARGIEDGKFSKIKYGPSKIFNLEELNNLDEPLFIVEGEIDAMSIIMAGGKAIGLGSLSNVDKFLDFAEAASLKVPLILALDNDEASSSAGNKMQQKLLERKNELKNRGINLHFADVKELYIGHKDANEALCSEDYFDFAPRVEAEKNLAIEEVKREEKALIEELRKQSVFNSMEAFDQCIEDSKTCSYIPTGFELLDKELDGGLFPGLYVIGAISSLGKTTFCIQVADQIAKQGKDVLIFSLEMSKNEIIAKSLSRLTLEIAMKETNSNMNAKTTRGILTGSRYEKYSEEEKKLIEQAKAAYKEYAEHLYIYEAKEEITVQSIRKLVENHTRITGSAPVVIIDYLQIIDASKDQQFLTDKQVTDKNVKALKIISRDFNTTVIGISSFNRDNYAAPVNMASFKESGAIEYSSDVLIGLQYKEMENLSSENNKVRAQEMFNRVAEKAKKGFGIDVQVKILKNRNGNKGNVDMVFFPMFNRFRHPINCCNK